MEDQGLIRLLVVSYFFPPYKRVGGRRWAKHVKYLNRLGVSTQVLTGDFPNSTSSWDDDILEYRQNITRLPLDPVRKPYYETALPKGFADKVRWKLSYYAWQIKKRFFKGNYNDVSLPNRDRFLRKATELIEKHAINTVIVSIGPFAYADLLVQVKQRFPSIRLVLDYRDPWEEALVGLTTKQKIEELHRQLRLLKLADLVLTVNDDISQRIRNIYKGVKVVTLPHSVDEDFLSLGKTESQLGPSKGIKMVYGGELYSGLQNEMSDFVAFVDLLSERTGEECQAALYSPYPSYESILAKSKHVSLGGTLLKDDYQRELSSSDLILLFKSPLSSEAFFSSKFYEILCLRKPLLFFGRPGMVSEYIQQHGLGFHVTPENMQAVCEAVIENRQLKKIPSGTYDLHQHSFEFHTKKLVETLKSLNFG